ncbi:hypothetical protein HOK51_08920 [Candidatus Woesearchaeota archaeon]|nr:hypothetical protein [Candidatus Woesearchaeota archaeon]MBT6519950.1 hypothetical protein [Candidatus Woesearchaeota archaeon]MBT7367849.1 hypothetical protein [Candidatus Woesearchaeota archaeon]
MTKNLNITPEISELCGIISGDGHLSRYVSSKRSSYKIEIAGDKTEEIDYFKHISLLFYSSFKVETKFKIKKNYANLYIHSKKLLEFFENIGIIVGKKSGRVRIPQKIINNNELSLHFLRGLADTDFSICFKKGNRKSNSYPRIIAEFCSEEIIKDIQTVLDRLKISYCNLQGIKTNSFGTFNFFRLEINGINNLNKWLRHIGFSNPKHSSKIKVWNKLGYCPPKTTYSERMKIIKEEGVNRPASKNSSLLTSEAKKNSPFG